MMSAAEHASGSLDPQSSRKGGMFSFLRPRHDSPDATKMAPADGMKLPPPRHYRSAFLGRRARVRSGSRETVDIEIDGHGGSGHAGHRTGFDSDNEEAEVADTLLRYELAPKRRAEDAKAAATRSAQIREEYVAQEMQVRQMWRIVMGNAPGLKAEIAKLHATERAKLVLREFENQERAHRSWAALEGSLEKHDSETIGSGSSSGSTTMGGDGGGSRVGAAGGEPVPSSPIYYSSDSEARALIAASSRHRSGHPGDADAIGRDARQKQQGVFGWVFGAHTHPSRRNGAISEQGRPRPMETSTAVAGATSDNARYQA